MTRTDSAQEEQLGLPYWTMIWAICVVVDESKCLDTPIWEFLIICEHLPFSLGYKLILRRLLVHRNLAIWRWYPFTFAAVICEADDPCSVDSAWDPESSFTTSPRSTTRPLYFWCFVSNSAFFEWHVSINEAKWTVAPFVLAASITSFLLLTFVRFHAEICSDFFPLLVHCCLCCRNFHGLGHRNKFVYQIVMLQWIVSFSCTIHLDTLTFEFSTSLERPPFFSVQADAASAACPVQSGSPATTSITFAAVIHKANDPCSVHTAYAPESSLTLSPRSTTRPLDFWCLNSTTAFFRWHKSINEAKWMLLLSICASLKDILFVFNFIQLPCLNFLELCPFFKHCCFRILNFHRLEHRKICSPECNE